MKYWDDFKAGESIALGSHTITEAEILEFARQFDPQPFHVDPEAAKSSVFGGLIASGWHTGAMWMRLYVDSLLDGAAAMGSPGIEELRWLAPVRPGDTLRCRFTLIDSRPSGSKSDRGVARFRYEVVDQTDRAVMTMVLIQLLRRRPL